MRLHRARNLAAGGALALLALPMLSGCNREPERRAEAPPPKNARPIARPAPPAEGEEDPNAGVTPMEQRVAVLGLLNKRNGLVRDLTLKPGESIRVGRAVVRLRACERTGQWESPQETGAFVQLLVFDYGSEQWRRAFSGWLFRERPERNIIQHPIYDVFVRSCTMRWPGETDPEAADGEDTAGPSVGASDANRRSSAPQRAEPASAPANAPAPAAPAPAANGAEANSESADNAR